MQDVTVIDPSWSYEKPDSCSTTVSSSELPAKTKIKSAKSTHSSATVPLKTKKKDTKSTNPSTTVPSAKLPKTKKKDAKSTNTSFSISNENISKTNVPFVKPPKTKSAKRSNTTGASTNASNPHLTLTSLQGAPLHKPSSPPVLRPPVSPTKTDPLQYTDLSGFSTTASGKSRKATPNVLLPYRTSLPTTPSRLKKVKPSSRQH